MDLKDRNDLGKLLADRGLLGDAAEIGVAEGRFSLDILRWGVAKLYLVDLWKHVEGHDAELGGWSDEQHNAVYQQCMDYLKEHADRIVVLRGWSHLMATEVPDKSLDFLHVDASHAYESVKSDLAAWYPKMREGVGAIVSGHDYSNPAYGVKQAVDEFAAVIGAEIDTLPGADDWDDTWWFEIPNT